MVICLFALWTEVIAGRARPAALAGDGVAIGRQSPVAMVAT
ncbi:hypothetical protein ACTJIL_03560 [Luteimonas sp. 22616]|jgi:hypothetical protein